MSAISRRVKGLSRKKVLFGNHIVCLSFIYQRYATYQYEPNIFCIIFYLIFALSVSNSAPKKTNIMESKIRVTYADLDNGQGKQPVIKINFKANPDDPADSLLQHLIENNTGNRFWQVTFKDEPEEDKLSNGKVPVRVLTIYLHTPVED